MRTLRTMAADFLGLWRTCGPWVAIRWLAAIARHAGSILRTRNLQVADRSLGDGPYAIRHPSASRRFLVRGAGVVSGIREMYVRDCYLRQGTLTIDDGAVVLDLGANLGNFTNLALAHGPAVHVVAVEPSALLNRMFEESVGLNAGFRERVTLIRGFLGVPCEKHTAVIREDPHYRDAPWLGAEELLALAGVSRIDFLKCDIEGGEFALLGPGSRLADMARTLAVEIHSFAGDVDGLIASLCTRGWIPAGREDQPDGTCVFLARRAPRAGD